MFVPRGINKYTIFGRSLENDKEVTVLNTWNNGEYSWNSFVYPKDRMKDLKGNAIRVTSFQYAPFTYKVNPEDENEEFQGMEVNKYHNPGK